MPRPALIVPSRGLVFWLLSLAGCAFVAFLMTQMGRVVGINPGDYRQALALAGADLALGAAAFAAGLIGFSDEKGRGLRPREVLSFSPPPPEGAHLALPDEDDASAPLRPGYGPAPAEAGHGRRPDYRRWPKRVGKGRENAEYLLIDASLFLGNAALFFAPAALRHFSRIEWPRENPALALCLSAVSAVFVFAVISPPCHGVVIYLSQGWGVRKRP